MGQRFFFFQINLIAPPLYVVTTQTLERTDGLEALNKAIVAIKASIEDAGGMFNIQLQVLVNNTTCTTQNGAIDAVKTYVKKGEDLLLFVRI